MKILYYDCFSGISGDMNLGAMLDLGVDQEYLLKELSRLGLENEYEISIREEKRKGIKGTSVEVKLKTKTDSIYDSGSHARTLGDIRQIIMESTLSDKVKSRSLKMFEVLAGAEARVHGTTKEKVHFHEVGAVDAILDIVGAALSFEYLQVDQIIASRVELGGGFVQCDHGWLPVPAPAVAELVKGIPVSMGRVQSETTTPTGAAILAANVNAFAPSPEFTIERIGYGVGKRDTEIPNVLRVVVGIQMKEKATIQYMVETNIDDMNPEFFELAEERLFSAGALDIFKTPIMMKKGRPAVQLSVLTTLEKISAVEEIILRETTAIGLRKYPIEKAMLDREIIVLNTPYGPVRVKASYLGGKRIKAKPEYEDCKGIAKENNLTLQEVYKAVSGLLGDS